jgi:ABC-2 type transport system permease protein
VIAWSMAEMQTDPSGANLAAFAITLICGAVIIYSIWLSAVTLAFKAVDIGDLMQILNGVYEAGRWPVTIYPIWLRTSLTVVIPLAFAITVPAELISERVDWWWLLVAMGVAIAAFWVSRWIWRSGIRNYSGASA